MISSYPLHPSLVKGYFINQRVPYVENQEFLDQILSVLINILRHVVPSVTDILQDTGLVRMVKWRSPDKHFVKQTSQSPEIYHLGVPFLLEIRGENVELTFHHLWSKVLCRATN